MLRPASLLAATALVLVTPQMGLAKPLPHQCRCVCLVSRDLAKTVYFTQDHPCSELILKACQVEDPATGTRQSGSWFGCGEVPHGPSPAQIGGMEGGQGNPGDQGSTGPLGPVVPAPGSMAPQ